MALPCVAVTHKDGMQKKGRNIKGFCHRREHTKLFSEGREQRLAIAQR